MFALIKQWFAPPVVEEDDEKTLHVTLLNAVTVIILVFSSLVFLGNVMGGKTPLITSLLNIVAFTVGIVSRRWIHRGNTNTVGIWMLIFGFLIITGSIASLGTVRTPTTSVYLLFVLLAGVLFAFRGVLITTIISSLSVLGFVLAENTGILPTPDYTVTITQWVTYTGLFAIAGGIVLFTLQITRKALTRATNEIIERRYTEVALKESQTRLQTLADSTIQSFMLLDRNGRVSFYNRAAAQSASILLGLDIQEGDPRTKFIIKGNSLGFNENFQKALQGEVITSENFLHTPNDEEVWLSFTYTPTHDEDGNISGVCLNVVDITERKLTEAKMRQQNEYLSNLHQISLDLLSRQKTRTLLNNIVHNAMLLVNAHHGYIFLPEGDSLHLSAATPGFAHHIGRHEPKPGAGVLGHVWQSKETVVVENYSEWEFRDPAYEKDGLGAIAGIPIKTGNDIVGVLEVVNTKSPRTFKNEELQILTRFATLAALVLDNARLLDATEYEITERKRKELILQTHVSEIEQLQTELREQALRDPLTNLYNRRYLAETLEREVARAQRERKSTSVAIMDIDHFKKINDTYGHQVGDKFLMAIADLLKLNIRDSDVACRYGGEEFLLVLPGATAKAALKRAEQLREQCAKIYIHHEDKVLYIKISIGIATFPTHARDTEELLIKADKALYQSKRAGRNRVTVWSGS